MAKPTLYTKEIIDRYSREGYWRSTTISDYWEQNARLYPDREAMVDSRVRLSWSQAKVWIDRLALGFLEMGLKKDDVVVIQLPNCAELACLRVACERAGLLHVPVVRVFRHAEMEHILKSSEAKAVVIPWIYKGFNHFEMIQELKPALPELNHILIWGNEHPQSSISLKEMLSNPVESKYPSDYLSKKKTPWYEFSLIGTTTGTTGKPKLVEQPICALVPKQEEIDSLKMTGNDIVAAMSNAVLGPNVPIYTYAPIVAAKMVMLGLWSVEAALELVQKEKVTILGVVPTQLVELNAYANLKKYDLSSLRIIYCTGSLLPYHLALELEDKLKCPIINVYGAIDYGGMSRPSVMDAREIRLLTVGRPLPGNEVKIVDAEGKEVSEGETGRIAFRGARAAGGYYKDPITTAEKWTSEGWYITGDLGKLDEKGYLHIAGRGDDMIIRGGQNIMPTEVENLLLSHPKVKDAAIIGIPDPIMGERACACIVPKAGLRFSFDEMVSFLKEKRIAPYKLPEKLLIFESLPYVQSIKLDRKQLKALTQQP